MQALHTHKTSHENKGGDQARRTHFSDVPPWQVSQNRWNLLPGIAPKKHFSSELCPIAQSPSLHHYRARPGHKFEWSSDIPWVFLTAKGDGRSVLAAQNYTQHTSFLLLKGTATLRCHITQGWEEPLQFCIHWKCPAKPLNVWSLWMTTHRQGNNVIGMNFSPYSPNLDGVWGSKSLGKLSCGKTMKRKWGKIPAESEFYLQICS